jgi:hypothetical protein
MLAIQNPRGTGTLCCSGGSWVAPRAKRGRRRCIGFTNIHKVDPSCAWLKKALIPFVYHSGDPGLSLLICFLRSILAISLDLSAQLPGEVLRGSSQA